MAGRNSAGQSRGRGPRTQGAAPAPLYDRVEDLRGQGLPTPSACASARAAARAALERTEMHVIHGPTPLPAQCRPSDQAAVELLQRQNELLTEILCVLNAQLAVGLGERPR